MFHCASLSSLGGVPRPAPLGHGPDGAPRPAAAAGRGGFGAIQPRYCTPPLIAPVPLISIFSSKSPASPPYHTRSIVPVGFSHEASTTIAPSSTFQLASPNQPLSVLPSKSDVQPSCSLKSTGSGFLKPPKRPR